MDRLPREILNMIACHCWVQEQVPLSVSVRLPFIVGIRRNLLTMTMRLEDAMRAEPVLWHPPPGMRCTVQ